MRSLPIEQIIAKIRSANPWWKIAPPMAPEIPYSNLRSRRYFYSFRRLAIKRSPIRALLLMGPRRVGKTVLAFHFIRWMIEKRGYDPKKIVYLDLQQPLYNGQGLE